MTPRVSDLTLERYRLGELPPGQAAELERRIAADPELTRRLAALAEGDEEIQARRHGLADGVRRRLDARPPRPVRIRRALGAAALAATALAAVALIPRLSVPPVDTGVRTKGAGPHLVLFRKTAEGTEALANGATVRAGELLRVGYRAAGRRYGAIVSIDGRGTVTRHLPREGGTAVPLRDAKTVLLDHAYELDDAPRHERFYLFTADTPFALAPVLEAAARAADGRPLSLDVEQSTFVLEKETRR